MPEKKQLTRKQQDYIRYRADGESQMDAARLAGYRESTVSQQPRSIEQQPTIQKALQRALKKAGVTEDYLAKRIKEGLEAKETKFFQYQGMVSDQRDVINFSERRQYVELSARIMNAIPKQSEDRTDLAGPVQLTVVYVNAQGQIVEPETVTETVTREIP